MRIKLRFRSANNFSGKIEMLFVRDDGKRFIMGADEFLMAFVELERQVIHSCRFVPVTNDNHRDSLFLWSFRRSPGFATSSPRRVDSFVSSPVVAPSDGA